MPLSDTDWGVHLPTMGLIIGWVDIAMGLLQMVVTCVALFHLSTVTDQAAGNKVRSQKDLDAMKLVSSIVLCSYLVLILFQIVAAVLLVVGVSEDKHHLLLPWLIINVISIVVKIFTVVYLLLITIVEDVNYFLQFLINVLTLGLHIWLWLIVLSLYRYIRDKK